MDDEKRENWIPQAVAIGAIMLITLVLLVTFLSLVGR
jgi:hypothetical protein